MTALFARLAPSKIRAAFASAAVLLLVSCGGGVSAPTSPQVNNPTLSILPGTGTILYSGLPTTFILSGGTGAYILTSSNQAVIPVAGGVNGGSVTIVPSPVTADTTVTLTMRDTGTAAPVTADVIVRPGTVANNVTITPNAQQSPSCSPGICSGGDAEVRVTISQGGIPLAARGIRFDVVAGDFAFITTPVGAAPEQTALSVTVATDETGIARARIRVTALAPNQTALMRITEVASGAFRSTSFGIAQFTGNTPAFFTLPASITFTGPFANICPGQAATRVTIFGGSPPYAIAASSSAITLDTSVVTASGSGFILSLTGTASGGPCITNAPVSVTDSTGRTISVQVSTVAGTGTAPAPAIVLTPTSLSLACSVGLTTVSSSLTVTGGTSPFSAGTDHPRITVTVKDRTVTVTRLAGDGTTSYPTTAVITVTDGATTAAAGILVPANCP